jgi:uncharacterized protein YdaU (DUF1376 family)
VESSYSTEKRTSRLPIVSFLEDLRGCLMHYYQFHIGDYASHTRHLSIIEDIAYRRLLDFYYLHESPIKTHDIARQIGMREYEQDVLTVLDEFFLSTPEGFVNTRADKEIEHFHTKVEQASRAGKASAERRINARSTDVQPTNNQEPITNNHKPIKKTATVVATPDGVSEIVWKEFVNHRKSKKAQITQTVINEIAKQANMAGWTLEDALKETIVRNWQSFKADWVASKTTFAQQAADIARTTVPGKQERDPALVKLDQDKLITKPPSLETLQKIAMLRTK